MKTKLAFLTILITLFLFKGQKGYSQEIQISKEDSIANVLQGVKSDVDALKKLKITGYIQAQYQLADTIGTTSFAGGNFPGTSDNRVMIRRGRIKFMYGNELSHFVLQFDVSEKGFSTKDIYFKATEPYLNALSITGGVFNRPFGYEIAYSSSNRESPERARFTQTLFPGERDLGAMISFNPPKTSVYNFFRIDAGLFAGNGVNPEFDKVKDFIGRVSVSKSTKSEKIKYGIGVSYYNGSVFKGSDTTFNMTDTIGGSGKGFVKSILKGSKSTFADRQYVGFDAQLSFETPVGISTLRGEYVFGIQPGTQNSTDVKKPNYSSVSPTLIPTGDTYNRKFSGFYVYFVQNILQSKHQIVVKYDVYDPNTEVAGKDIVKKVNGKTSYLGSADIKYSTLGLGYIYKFDKNLKLTVYYDIVSNELTGITGTGQSDYTKDLKDNVLTIRLQYKF